MRKKYPTSPHPGFTLIELVMAIVIGGIIFIPLLNIFGSVPVKNTGLEALNMAVHLADYKMETVCSKSFTAISSEEITAIGGIFPDFNSQVVMHYVASTDVQTFVDTTPTSYKWIKVMITSASLPGGSVELISLVTDVSNK